MMATITVVLSSTLVNVALPDIMGVFGIGQDQAQWMSTGFLAAMTASMLTQRVAERRDWCGDPDRSNGTTLELISRVAGLDSSWGVPATQTVRWGAELPGPDGRRPGTEAYGDGFALVAIAFWVAILPALWMRPKN